MSSVVTIGLDLAKSIFQIHGVDDAGRMTLRRRLSRHELVPYFAKISPCLIGMEACSAAHHWARELSRFGHSVRLIPPQYAKPYVKRNKTDAADAEAICEAVARPNMRYVPIKTLDQQSVLSLHRVRALFVRQRTAAINTVRGLLTEFGIIAGKGIGRIAELRSRANEADSEALPDEVRRDHRRLRTYRRVDRADRRRGGEDRRVAQEFRHQPAARHCTGSRANHCERDCRQRG